MILIQNNYYLIIFDVNFNLIEKYFICIEPECK